jgi:hypothetical protein
MGFRRQKAFDWVTALATGRSALDGMIAHCANPNNGWTFAVRTESYRLPLDTRVFVCGVSKRKMDLGHSTFKQS